MKKYKLNIKRRLLTALGVLDEDLAHDESLEFDREIARSGAKCLSDKELMVFFHLFRCEASYESTRNKVNMANGTDYPVNTIVKYARRSIDRLVAHVHKDKRLSGWISRCEKRNDRENAN